MRPDNIARRDRPSEIGVVSQVRRSIALLQAAPSPGGSPLAAEGTEQVTVEPTTHKLLGSAGQEMAMASQGIASIMAVQKDVVFVCMQWSQVMRN